MLFINKLDIKWHLFPLDSKAILVATSSQNRRQK